jgi:hypothetical protein
MYRSSYTNGTCGSYSKLNATPFTATTYVDSNPTQGIYCYAATAVNGTQESGFSNVDSNISIPPPPPTGLGAAVAGLQVDFNWTQSAGNKLTENDLYCASKASGPFSRKLHSKTPIVSASIQMAKGKHYCGVTASSGSEQSGLSNEVLAQVE